MEAFMCQVAFTSPRELCKGERLSHGSLTLTALSSPTSVRFVNRLDLFCHRIFCFLARIHF